MSLSSVKTSLYLQETNLQRQGRPLVTTTSHSQGEAQPPHRRQGSEVTFDDVAHILASDVGDEEEQIDLATELGNLLGSYKRMN